MNMDFERKLSIPMEVKEMYPITPTVAECFARRDEELKKILRGEDDRLIVIVGPCSADNIDSVLDYMLRLRKVSDKVSEKLFIVPRLYTNKPRTAGVGYKGLLHQPDPNERPDLFKGIIATREIHMKVLTETGFSCADELLYPDNFKYIDDLVGYVAVGARSVEDQQHRLTASGIEVPVGMKNPTGGDFKGMLNAVATAGQGHSFIYRGWAAHSKGNPYAHCVLRGYTDMKGNYIPNYKYENLNKLCEMYDEMGLMNPAVIIDANHANSGKNPFRQPEIVKEVMDIREKECRIKNLVKGFMIESYIEDGCQKPGGTVYGQSITDPCLGFDKTEKLIMELAEK